MAADLFRSRLRKRFGLVTGASRNQREGEQADDNGAPTLLHVAPSMIHSHLLPSGDVRPVILLRRIPRSLLRGALFKCAPQIENRLHNTSVYGRAAPSLIVEMV